MKYLLQETAAQKLSLCDVFSTFDLMIFMQLFLLLNASQVSLCVWFVQGFFYFGNLLELKIEIGLTNGKVVVGCDG